ncbi:MAG: hypothetical protein ABI658_07840 [Acidimicrobiales bacterium]
MDEDVVPVEERDHGITVQGEALQSALGEDVQVALDTHDAAGVGDRLRGVVSCEVPNLAISEEDRHDQGEFAERA